MNPLKEKACLAKASFLPFTCQLAGLNDRASDHQFLYFHFILTLMEEINLKFISFGDCPTRKQV